MLDLMPGVAHGFRGSWATSDCSSMMDNFAESIKDIGTAVADIFNKGETVVAPFFRAQTSMVALSNVNVACQTTAIASQLNIRFNTAAGLADLAYTIYNVAKEGFFDGLYDSAVENAIWSDSYALRQGLYGRESMSCLQVGFRAGSVFQSLVNF